MTTPNDYRNPKGMTDLERQMATPFGQPSTFETDQLRARIEALIAERDAAAAKLAAFAEGAPALVKEAQAEGERRATAAIVAWLRDDAGKTRDDLSRLHRAKKLTPMMTAEWEAGIMTKAGIANAIERGDHITEAKPADMSATKAP
jgi:hypothetical protein